MDLPVEATVHLNVFHNKAEVQEILQSHDFQLTDLNSDRIHVKGSFLKLKAAKASLEQLLDSQAKAHIATSPAASSGAISKHCRNSSLTRSNKVKDKVKYGSLPLPSTSKNRGSFSSRPEQRGSIGHRSESFVIDADVFAYADRLLDKDIQDILHNYDVTKDQQQVGKNMNITVIGENAKIAASKLQKLLSNLNQTLRTQEVQLRDMGSEGRTLYERIQNNSNIHESVLVFRMDDRLHLIGPSRESHELKMKLLERQRGKWLFRSLRWSSGSRPRIGHKNTSRDDHAIGSPAPEGAAGFSLMKHQSQKDAEMKRSAPHRFSLRGRSSSESRRNHIEERHHEPDVERRRPPPRSAKAFFKQLFSFKNTKSSKSSKSSKKG